MIELDETLARLFAEDRETLPDEDFLQAVALRMSRARRRRALGRAGLAVATAGVAITLTPYVAEGSLALASHLGTWLPAFGTALTSPAAWACSLAAAAWVLRRARHVS